MIKNNYEVRLWEGWKKDQGRSTKKIKANYMVIPDFRAYELCCPTKKEIKFHEGFDSVLKFIKASVNRYYPNRTFVVNSACRSRDHNDKVGGHPRSLHLTNNPHHPTHGCMAIDISLNRWTKEEFKCFLDIATNPLIGGSIGRGERDKGNGGVEGFVHFDMRTWIGLPQTEFYYK